ncbi:MAG: MFS transporter, partial [Pseudomonadota bacterium]
MSNTQTPSATRLSAEELKFIGRMSTVSVSRMFGLFMVLPVLALWADDFANATPILVGIAVGGYGVTQALLQIPYGAVSDRLGRAPVIVFGLSVFLAGSVIAATASGIWGVIVGRLLQGAGAVSATLSAWLADRTRDTVRTPAMAIFGASIGASFLLALVLGPLVSALLGVRGLFWLSAALGGLG